mmetsp:Transcript_51510/g.122488  ORF Transcript_51510/g.122488 Transcript_51510/m.122488 type:complete len:265 (+) Transcript_51510:80-874(+)
MMQFNQEEELPATAFMAACAEADDGDVSSFSGMVADLDLAKARVGSASLLQAAVSMASAAATRLLIAEAERRGDGLDALGLNMLDSQGYAPLHAASAVGAADCVDILLKAGADLSLRTLDAEYRLGSMRTSVYSEGGRLPLHVAVENNQSEVVKVLVAHGASLEDTNSFGMTARDLLLEDLAGVNPGTSRQALAELLGLDAEQMEAARQRSVKETMLRRKQRIEEVKRRMAIPPWALAEASQASCSSGWQLPLPAFTAASTSSS